MRWSQDCACRSAGACAIERGRQFRDVSLKPLDSHPCTFPALNSLHVGTDLPPHGAINGTTDPGTDGHPVGLGEPSNLLDRLRGEANRHVLGKRPIGASTRSAGWSLAVGGIVVVIEGLGVSIAVEALPHWLCSNVTRLAYQSAKKHEQVN
jgi:hypothetical protein